MRTCGKTKLREHAFVLSCAYDTQRHLDTCAGCAAVSAELAVLSPINSASMYSMPDSKF